MKHRERTLRLLTGHLAGLGCGYPQQAPGAAPPQQLGHSWKEASLEAVFSVPKEKVGDFSRWYIVSIKVRDKK